MAGPILNPCIKGTRVVVVLDCPNREVLLKGKGRLCTVDHPCTC